MLYNVSITFIYFLSHLIITTVLQVRCHYPLIKEHWIWATVFKQKKKNEAGFESGSAWLSGTFYLSNLV